jgi:multisubunit Na+/H+ antiporter MnhE subunit
MAVVWIALFASATPGVILGGGLVALLVSAVLPGYRPRWPQGILRPVAVVRFIFAFARSLWMANVEVIRAVLSGRPLQPAVVACRLRVTTATELTLLMNAITFTPGSVALETAGDLLFVHVLDLRDEDAFRGEMEALESRIIRAFGTPRSRAHLREHRSEQTD